MLILIFNNIDGRANQENWETLTKYLKTSWIVLEPIAFVILILRYVYSLTFVSDYLDDAVSTEDVSLKDLGLDKEL